MQCYSCVIRLFVCLCREKKRPLHIGKENGTGVSFFIKNEQ